LAADNTDTSCCWIAFDMARVLAARRDFSGGLRD
jgi:hypothetical protein